MYFNVIKKRKLPDIISMLPDELIHYILSFIDTKYAVQTCILSKRWIHIWKCLPFLKFDISCYSDDGAHRQLKFVDRVFRLRDDFSCIKKLIVSWHTNSVSDWKNTLNRWIEAAVGNHLEEVNIDVSRYTCFKYEISPRLFNCKSLKKLTLSTSKYAEVVLPKKISLPQLKFMCLAGFRVSSARSAKRLFLSCPLLETLKIENCDIETDYERNLFVESSCLKQFAYTQLYPCIRPRFIKLSAPNLNSFICKSYWNYDYNLENCQDKLSEVKLYILYDSKYEKLQLEKKQEYARQMVKLLVSVGKAERLELSPGFIEVLSGATDLVNCQLPCLWKLQSLRLETWWNSYSLPGVAYLLTTCPNLKTLILKLIQWNSEDIERFLLPSMVSHLSAYRIENAKGCNEELKILDFLLKNAKCLEEVALYPFPDVESLPELRDKYKVKLRAYPRITMRWGLKRIICR